MTGHQNRQLEELAGRVSELAARSTPMLDALNTGTVPGPPLFELIGCQQQGNICIATFARSLVSGVLVLTVVQVGNNAATTNLQFVSRAKLEKGILK
jgi:hypothetical protein